ncbi:DUF4384 domain-containing protein [Deinococcus maricopensis]|uniref:S-layer-like protein array-related protein n=1 Tax=Deinococcus maricopensis (strain DSM 21211 / LMG 22137 / NRRL B-23946 / LB-34) TaxID=709986 RepID=E8UAK3_DEIML|nr:DUF4384 domain-containing protein [Deinococcus maricopensis]ADV68092.1 S-layer-like protein array-related protein [Deinococcus maricopensis DSM 21211]
MNKFLLPLTLLLGTASAAPQISAQSIIVNPVKPSLGVKVWTDRDATGAQTPIYRVGERIRLFVTPSQDAYVYLFNVNPDGRVDQILPNKFASGDAFVKANTVKAFPGTNDRFTFDIAGPNGVNKVLALASKTPLNLSQLSSFKSSQDSFATVNVTGQEKFAQALSIVVNPVPQNNWVTDTAAYNVAGATQATQPAPPAAQPLATQPAQNAPAERQKVLVQSITTQPAQNAPAWTQSGDWKYSFTNRQQTLRSVYDHYNRELQGQGYKMVSMNAKGNQITAQYRRDGGTATLTVKGMGNSGKFEVRVQRRS